MAHEQRLLSEFGRFYLENWEARKADLIRAWKEQQNPRINPPDHFLREFEEFKRIHEQSDRHLPMHWEDRYPCLNDRNNKGSFDRHYIIHLAWASRVLAETRPAKHIDIGSWLAFIAGISAFVPTEFYDFNLVELPINGLRIGQANLMALPFADNSIHSLSCMHVIEHVGLGRYGDPVDANGDLRAISELRRVLAPGGQLMIVFPMGRSRIEFNAHRVYDLDAALGLFSGFDVREFKLIPDSPSHGALIDAPSAEFVGQQHYACGCFLLRKI